MDFVHDTLADGRPFRILTGVNNWSRSSPVLETGFRMSGERVSQVLDRVLGEGQRPRSITVDHGTEFQSRALEDWAYRRGIQLDFIRPGKPVENAFIESFNGRLRDACLNVHQFTSLVEAQAIIEAWRGDYNTNRPHSSLGHLTPSEFVTQRQEEPTRRRSRLLWLRVVSEWGQRHCQKILLVTCLGSRGAYSRRSPPDSFPPL